MTTHNIEKTEGVVLKITPSKESDAILSIYTHDYGRISVYGKGIKKINSKNARGVTPSVEKELRIESIQPHFSNGFVKLSQTHKTLISQLREWPNHEHDDGPDALQMLWMAATTGANRKPTKVIHIPTPQLPRF